MSVEDRVFEGNPDENELPGIENVKLPDFDIATGTPFRNARTSILSVCFLLAIFAIFWLGCFFYQFFYRLPNGDRFVKTGTGWPAVLGHLIRGIGLGLICWRLALYGFTINSKTGELRDDFSLKHRGFWRMFATILYLLTAYTIFQLAYTSWRQDIENQAFFPPEFQSGAVPIAPDRIEFRHAYGEPRDGLVKMQIQHSEEFVFVSPNPDITGNDIADAKVEIGEIIPGRQVVKLIFKLTEIGAGKMEHLTKNYQTMPLALLIDGKLRSAPRIFGIISREGQISGAFTLEEAAKMIQDGAGQ